MANHASSKKRIRRNARRAVINGARRGRIRTFIKKVEAAIGIGDAAQAQEALQAAQPEIQRGVAREFGTKYGSQKNFPFVRQHQGA